VTLRSRLSLWFAAASLASIVLFGGGVLLALRLTDAHDAGTRAPGRLDDDLRENLVAVLTAMALAAPVALAGAVAAGSLLSRRAVGPLREARDQALRARASELDLSLPLDGNGDEWDGLASAINALLRDGRASLERIRRFTADAAHELRSPLAAMLGEADVVLRRERTPAQLREALAGMRAEAARLAHVVDGLLLLARADAQALARRAEPVDLSALAAQAARRAGAAIEVVDQGARIIADPALVSRALDNLIDNALRHGKLPVQVAVLTDGKSAVVRVEDHGPGVPPALASVLFERFRRGEQAPSEEGSGLGLSIARTIAELHGGSLALVPAASGAVFELRLPLRA
jgi:two-component system heavy metal sensor histidine kinase CusS